MLPGNSTDSNLKIWLLVRPTAGQRGTHRLLSCALFFSPVTSRVHDARSSRQPLLLSPDHYLGHSLHAQLSTTQHSPHPQPLGFSHFQDVSNILIQNCKHPKDETCHSKGEPTGSNSSNWPFRQAERLLKKKKKKSLFPEGHLSQKNKNNTKQT